MKVWLDDLRDPKKFGFEDFVWVKSFRELIILMKKHEHEITHFHLDHHIGDRFRNGFSAFENILSKYIHHNKLKSLIEIISHTSDEGVYKDYVELFNMFKDEVDYLPVTLKYQSVGW